MNLLPLSPIEARLLGVLIEKEKTVPDTYPLSLNALTTGCNQKTSREPVMNVSDTDALEALDRLKSTDCIIEHFGNRVTRYSHNLPRSLNLPTPAIALLTTLLLRGPQTVAELRANSERLYRFADASSIEAFLEELSARSTGALVQLLPRAPGTREARWCHLLCGSPILPTSITPSHSSSDHQDLNKRVSELEAQVAILQQQLAQILQS